MKLISGKDVNRYRQQFSRTKFHQKISTIPRQAGHKLLDQALILYILLTESDAPWWVKSSIVAVLGYLITPIDCVPDFLPGGLLDDLALISLLLTELHVHVTPEVEERARKLRPVK